MGDDKGEDTSSPEIPVLTQEVAVVSPPSATEEPVVPRADLVLLSFQSEPPGAQVFSTGESPTLLGVTPFEVSLDRRDEDVDFELRKDGFETLAQRIRLDRGGRIQVALQPVAEVAEVTGKGRHGRNERSGKKTAGTKEKALVEDNATVAPGETKKTMYKEGAVMNPFGNK